MAFIRDEEVAGLRIENMILHVVGDDAFVPQHARAVEHSEFFIDRIRDTDVDPVFAFNAASQTKAQIERISRDEVTFEEGGAGALPRLCPSSSRQ